MSTEKPVRPPFDPELEVVLDGVRQVIGEINDDTRRHRPPRRPPGAWVNLGILEKDAGWLEEARAAYQQAAATGHPDDAAIAAARLKALDENEP